MKKIYLILGCLLSVSGSFAQQAQSPQNVIQHPLFTEQMRSDLVEGFKRANSGSEIPGIPPVQTAELPDETYDAFLPQVLIRRMPLFRVLNKRRMTCSTQQKNS